MHCDDNEHAPTSPDSLIPRVTSSEYDVQIQCVGDAHQYNCSRVEFPITVTLARFRLKVINPSHEAPYIAPGSSTHEAEFRKCAPLPVAAAGTATLANPATRIREKRQPVGSLPRVVCLKRSNVKMANEPCNNECLCQKDDFISMFAVVPLIIFAAIASINSLRMLNLLKTAIFDTGAD